MRHKNTSELEACQEALRKAQDRIAQLQAEILKYQPGKGTAAQNIDGWTVQHSGGYFRLFKRINGKLHGVHVGRVLDEDVARRKIQLKEEQLQQMSEPERIQRRRK